MEGSQIRANGGTKEDAPQNLKLGPHVSVPEEGRTGGRPPGVGRPQGSAEPKLQHVQVHFGEE